MSIKFVCICGKRLRAREEMAARRSVCPRCGRPVGIPSLKPTHRGGEAKPLTPLERWARRKSGQMVDDFEDAPPPPPMPVEQPPRPARLTAATPPSATPTSAAAPRPLDPAAVRQVLPPRRRSRRADASSQWRAETRWYQYLAFPVRAGLYIVSLGAMLTLVTGCLTLLLPEFLQLDGQPAEHGVWVVPTVALLVLVAGYAFTLLDGALTTGCAGKPAAICWPGRDYKIALQASARWLYCLLPGPVFGLYFGFRYWLNSNDDVLDWIIVAEIGGLSLGYWLLLLLVVAQHGRLRDAHPLQVITLLGQLGPPALLVVTVAGVALLAHGLLVLYALSRLHGHGSSWLMLLGGYVSVLFWGVLLCRWLGLWCHRRTP